MTTGCFGQKISYFVVDINIIQSALQQARARMNIYDTKLQLDHVKLQKPESPICDKVKISIM